MDDFTQFEEDFNTQHAYDYSVTVMAYGQIILVAYFENIEDATTEFNGQVQRYTHEWAFDYRVTVRLNDNTRNSILAHREIDPDFHEQTA